MDIKLKPPPAKKPRFSFEEAKETNSCTKLNDKIKNKKINVKFKLKTDGENALLSVEANERIPLMLPDIQELLLHTIFGASIINNTPRWYSLQRSLGITHVTCLILEGCSIQHWVDNNSLMQNTSNIFNNIFELVTPSTYGGSLLEGLAAIPLSVSEKDDLLKKYGNMTLALESRKDLAMIKAVFPVRSSFSDDDVSTNDEFFRTQLILSAQQLIEENYPLPFKGKLKHIYSDYVMTKDCYEPVSASSPMFGVDCEMCLTHMGSELTRISIVNENHETIYESFVKPYNEITNYLTIYSGINASILANVTTRLEDVQKDLINLLPSDAILVGHSLNVDMHALKMMHPYVIDTSFIFNFSGIRNFKPKLKTLSRELLNEKIQEGRSGHCSVEDASASLKLVQLKLSKNIAFADAVCKKQNTFKNSDYKIGTEQQYASTIFNHLLEEKKKSMIIGCEDVTGDYHDYLMRANECSTSLLKKGKPKKIALTTVDEQKDVISTMIDNVSNYDFVIGHLKVCLNDNNKLQEIKVIDEWIKDVYDALEMSTFFTVIFTGSDEDNGVVMIDIKK